jgi:hypothetical protein
LRPYKKPKFERGLVKSLKKEEKVWKMKAKTKERERCRMKKCWEDGKSNRYKGNALRPYKNPIFEHGLVKSLKKEEEKDNFSSTCRSTISWAIASKGKKLAGSLTLSRFTTCGTPVHQCCQTFFLFDIVSLFCSKMLD